MKKKIKLGTKVLAADGEAGVIEKIIADPDDHQPGYLVIKRGHIRPRRILVPVSLVEEATPFEVMLSIDRKALENFPDYEVTVKQGAYRKPVPAASPRPFGVYAPPSNKEYVVLRQRNVPESSVSVERGMPVLDAAEMKVGEVHGLELEVENRQASHILVRLAMSHGTDYRIVPIDLVADVRGDEVHLRLHAEYVPALGVYRPASNPRGEVE